MMKSSIKAPRPRAVLALLCLLCLVPTLSFARDRQPVILTTIPPLYMLTEGVMEGVAKPALLMETGDNPHHFSMKPRAAQKLMEADVVICSNRSLETYLQPLLDATPERRREVVEAIEAPGVTLLPAADAPQVDAVLGHGFVDMHFWLSPTNATAYTQYIAGLLAELDPAHREEYLSNATAQAARLKALDGELTALFGKKGRDAAYASYHSSLAYFEKHYGIAGGKAITRTPESGASVQEAERLHQQIESGALRCLLQEPQFSPKLLQQAATQHSEQVTVITVDTLGSTYPLAAESYDAMLRDIATKLHPCLKENE